MSCDQRAQLDGVGEDKEDPIEEDDSIWGSGSRVLVILYSKDDQQGEDDCNGGIESDVSEPDGGELFDLKGGLEGSGENDGGENGTEMESAKRQEKWQGGGEGGTVLHRNASS